MPGVAAAAVVVKGRDKGRNHPRNPDYDAATQFLESTGRSLETEEERARYNVARNRKLAQALTDRRTEASERLRRRLHGLPHQNSVKDFYDRKAIQIFVAGLIIMNFFISAIEAQMFPTEPTPGEDDTAILIFTISEYFFAYVFLIELLVNFYGNYFWEFWKSSWNIFDFLIVTISLLALYMSNLPGISVLRLFRAFRVVRLFKRIKTMRVMMDSILRSLPGMSIAFVALFLIMGIYGIIGVNFWAESFPDYYGNFLKAVLTLLQIMTMDSWSSGIARPIIFADGAVAAIYFITYLFIASIIMANVLIALLLDEFMNSSNEERSEDNEMEDEQEELDQIAETHHAKLEEKFLGPDSDHFGLAKTSHKLASLMGQENNTQGNIVQGSSEMRDGTPSVGDNHAGGGVEMTKYRKPAPTSNHRANSGGYGGAPAVSNQNDPAWRATVDQNIRTLARSLDKLHLKLDQLLPQVQDYGIQPSGGISHMNNHNRVETLTVLPHASVVPRRPNTNNTPWAD